MVYTEAEKRVEQCRFEFCSESCVLRMSRERKAGDGAALRGRVLREANDSYCPRTERQCYCTGAHADISGSRSQRPP